MGVTSWIRRQFKNGVSVVDYVPAGFGSGATSFTAHDGSTFPDGSVGNFIVTADQGLATEEKILCSSRSGAVFTVANGGRGYNGYTAQNHGTNCSILHTLDAQDLDEANQVAVQTLGAIAAKGDLLVGSAANTLAKLSVGTTSQFLQVVSGTLAYVSFGSGGVANVGTASTDGTSTNPARYDHVHGVSDTVVLTRATYDPAAVVQQVVGTTATQTLTLKRITRRYNTIAQSATPTFNTDSADGIIITGLAQNITSMTTNVTGTPVAGDQLTVRITDNGTARTITWGTLWEAGPGALALPTSTVISTKLEMDFRWDDVNSKWMLVNVVGAPALTSAAGHLAGDVNPVSTAALTTFLTTAALAVGTWRIELTVDAIVSAAVGCAIQVNNGTATATFEGASATEISGITSSVSMSFIATVTAPGTLVFQAKSTGSSSVIKATTQSFALNFPTGYTAVRIA